jgi:uncharacterized Fe-S cluster-containing radical SAM superfamily protein
MKKKTKIICVRPLKEVTILSDGRITTCCLDPKGLNTFASIYDENFDTTFSIKFQELKQKFVENIKNFPFCVQCIKSRKNYYNDFHKKKPSAEEISAFLDEKAIPKGLVIEMTSHCNLKCGRCLSGLKDLKEYRQKGFIDGDTLKKWLISGINKIKNVRLYNYGETFLHPDAIDFCSFLTRENPSININIATNLILLNTDEKIEKLIKAQPNVLIVSLHGASQKSVSKFMGPNANFELALDIMRNITIKRKKLGLDFPVNIWKYLLLVFNDSDEEMFAAQSILKKYEIDFLGFDIATGPFASKRFYKGSKDFEELKKSEYYIGNLGQKIARQKLKRKLI